jgi:hypothetical protein
LKPGNRRHVAADMRLRCQLLPIGRDTRDAGRSRHRIDLRWRLSFSVPHGVDADESVGERSQRIGAWWKPEEPIPRRICPPSHRLNGSGSWEFAVRSKGNPQILRTANSEHRTSPVGCVGSPPIPGEGWACISGAPYPSRLWPRGRSEQGGTVSVARQSLAPWGEDWRFRFFRAVHSGSEVSDAQCRGNERGTHADRPHTR